MLKKRNKEIEQVFFALLRSGLWERECRLSQFMPITFTEVLKLAQEQSSVGLIAAGIGHVKDMKLEKKDVLPFIGQTLQLEYRNTAMNNFIGVIVEKMREEGIKALLVKGQGIAQCYERPLWRSCGDVDLLLDDENYQLAKPFLIPMAASVDEEDLGKKHLGMTIDPWVVELHGSLHGNLAARIDRMLDEIQQDTFRKDETRIWKDGETDVLLPNADNDVIFVFTHILQHFFKGGIGVRQICDWCRLLWTYRDEIDHFKLEMRLKRMGLMSEWKAFAEFAVKYLGMPSDAMPLYSQQSKWRRKAQRINAFIMKMGNFGHNQDMSYINKKGFVTRKLISLAHSLQYTFDRLHIFPKDSLAFYIPYLFAGSRDTLKGKR